MKRNKKRLNNKGFSLVELIVVIAIMAILAGVLAPQLMKYIGKSRDSVDSSNCDSIKSAVEVALADEVAYEDAVSIGNGSVFTFKFNGNEPTNDELAAGAFKNELTDVIGTYPKVKGDNVAGFEVTIDADMNVSVSTYTD
jgi:type IV pilus assembly protein PilA